MKLDSLDFVRLISWLAYNRHSTILNKTQMQKILFICYGLVLARYDSRLFEDDTPKAWPFGPVFPRSYVRYKEKVPADLSDADKAAFSENRDVLMTIVQVADKFYKHSAVKLSEWAHRQDSPWYRTLFSDKGKDGVEWNKEIPDEYIKETFAGQWEVGL